jgi:hypothetical protein
MSRPPSGFHAAQIPLNLPRVLSVAPFTKLPRPNAIDDWLAVNYTDSIHDCFEPGYMHLGDLLHDEMMCILQLHARMVRFLPLSPT